MLRFNLEEMNQLEFFDATETPSQQGMRNITVTGPDQPYSGIFWKPGHTIGYEHTFIATLGDFLGALSRKESRYPDFDDAVRVQRVLDAVERSAESRAMDKGARKPMNGNESRMRVLNFLSGVAILLTTLAFGHLLHHYFIDAAPNSLHDPGFMAGMATGVVVGIFSFIGGCLLLRRGR